MPTYRRPEDSVHPQPFCCLSVFIFIMWWTTVLNQLLWLNNSLFQ